MQQKYITIDELKIAYLEINPGLEKTVFFIHGNSISSRSWEKQLNSSSLNDYTLIAIDLPGHGNSAQSVSPDAVYTFYGLGAIIAKTIKILSRGNPYLLAGLSLGTNILTEALAFDLAPVGLLLAGSCVAGQNISVQDFVLPHTHVSVVFTPQADEADIRAYALEVMHNASAIEIEEFVADYHRADPQFRSVLAKSIAEGNFSDEIALLQHINKPLLFIFGKEEKIINPDYLDKVPFTLWRNEIFKIDGAGHLVNMDNAETFNRLLAAYAADCFSGK